MLVDQGFRDARTDFQNNGYIVKAPHHAPSGVQLTTLQANESRLVTKIRHHVENGNGFMKQIWKIFGITWESLSVPHLMEDFTIGAALYNRFYANRHEDAVKSMELATRMLALVPLVNRLATTVSSKAFSAVVKKGQYSEMTDFTIFPELELDDLKDIAFGIYQIRQAKCYTIQHLDRNDTEFVLQIFNEEVVHKFFQQYANVKPQLVTMRLASRFVSTTEWCPYVLFNTIENGKRAILEYCCNCKVGKRTVGSCSHVMCILFYLGYWVKKEYELPKKAKHLQGIFV